MFSVLCDTKGYTIVSIPFLYLQKINMQQVYIYIFSPLNAYKNKNKFPTQVDTPSISPFGPVSVSPAP